MKRLLVLTALIAMALLVSFPSWVLAQATDPAAVVAGFHAAANDLSNPEAALEWLADDVTVRLIPPPPPPGDADGVITGQEEARGYLQFRQAQNTHWELEGSWQVNGDTVTGTVLVTTDRLEQWGVAPVEHMVEAVVEDGKIKTFTVTAPPSELERVAAARAALEQPPTLPSTGGQAGSPGWLWLYGLGGLIFSLGLALRYAQSRSF